MQTVILRLPKSLHRRAAEIAEERGESLNKFCNDSILEYLGLKPDGDIAEIEALIHELIHLQTSTSSRKPLLVLAYAITDTASTNSQMVIDTPITL